MTTAYHDPFTLDEAIRELRQLRAENKKLRAIEAEVRAEAQEPVAKVTVHYNYGPDYKASVEWLTDCRFAPDTLLYAAPQPPAPCPQCAEAERIEALATAKLGDEIIKNGSLQDRLAQLECDFALEHDDKLELQAKVAELENSLADVTEDRALADGCIKQIANHICYDWNGGLAELVIAELDKVAEQSAEIERLKTVPMKYRRMAFNAQLQEENAKLAERIAELEDELRVRSELSED